MSTYKVKYAGICGSDINKVKSANFDIDRVLCLGHEIVCESEDGTLYVVNPFLCNSDCKECDKSSFLYCNHVYRLGFGTENSGFSGKISVMPDNLFKIPACKNPQIGVLCDGISVVFHGFHMIDITLFSRIAIVGSGSIGVLAALILKDKNPNCAIDIFVRDKKKKDYLNSIYYGSFNVIDINAEISLNQGYELVIEAIGGMQTFSLSKAIDIVSESGTILVFGAFDVSCASLQGIRKLFYKQITMIGVNSFCKKYNDFENAVIWAFEHEDLIAPMITDQVRISRENIDANHIYQNIIYSKTLKGCFIYE